MAFSLSPYFGFLLLIASKVLNMYNNNKPICPFRRAVLYSSVWRSAKRKEKDHKKKEKTMHVSYVYVVDTENALIEANQDFSL